ncbi:MAG: LysR family transcriptional regulator [Pseudomonadota bacterium]
MRHIEVFHAVYTCGSVTKASEVLNVSQPSVSKVLSHAEGQLGYRLFDRSGGRMVPTLEAEKLYEHVDHLFDKIGTVRRVAQNLRKIGDDAIRLASTPALGVNLVPEMVASFLTEYPGTYFELETLHFEEIVSALRESRIDIAFAFDPSKQAEIKATPIASGQFVLIKPRHLALPVKKSIKLSQLKNLPFVRLNNRGPLGQLLDSYLDSAEASFNIVAATETYQIAHALVSRGIGVSIVDEITAKSNDSPDVEVIPLNTPLNFDVCAVQSSHTKSSNTTDTFLDHAKLVATQLLEL